MVRNFFSSPGGTPNGERRLSRKERLEQAKRAAEVEKSRRRNFGFLKTGDKRMSTASLNKTREHAKQLAMVYSDPAETPTSVYAEQQLLGGGQSQSQPQSQPQSQSQSQSQQQQQQQQQQPRGFGFNDEDPFDPFSHGGGSSSNSNTFNTKTASNARTSGSILDHHFAAAPHDREFTASTQDSFDTASVGSAYDMDFLAANSATSHRTHTTPKKKTRTSLAAFVEKNESPFSATAGAGGSLNDASGSRGNSRRGERSIISMPTFPSNSSMQASYARQQPQAQSQSQSSSSNNAANGAAARRRMRSQLRHNSSSSSVSSVNSGGDASSYCSTPPESPASVKNSSSAGRNRLAAYQRGANGSFYSQNSSNSQQSGSDSNPNPNLFDSDNLDGGFTFDAFGLDQSQVEREVNEAMQELAGQGMPGFSMFLNSDQEEDFEPQNWDSPVSSRRSSPAPPENQEGFVDGFRVTQSRQQTYPQVQSSPDRSFTSPASRRLMRSQAKGATTPPRWETHAAKKQQEPKDFNDAVNPWKEDPWGSDPEDTNKDFPSDAGSGSDFGGAKSEVLPSAFQPHSRFTDSKSDVGSSTFNKSVSFHQDVRVPQGQNYISDEEEMEEMKEDLAQEFAQEFVNKISPRHEDQQQQQRVVEYGHEREQQQQHGLAYGHEQQQQHVVEYGHGQQQQQMIEDGHGNGQAHYESAGEDQDGQQHELQARFDQQQYSQPQDYGQSQPQLQANYGADGATPDNVESDYGAHRAASNYGSGAYGAAPQYTQQRAYGQGETSDYEQSDYGQEHSSDYGPSSSSYHSNAGQDANPDPNSGFNSFRSKYESSREAVAQTSYRARAAEVVINDYGPSKSPTAASYRSSHAQVEQPRVYGNSEVDYHEDMNMGNVQDYGPPRASSSSQEKAAFEYGNLRSSYASAKARIATTSNSGQSPAPTIRESAVPVPEWQRPTESDYDRRDNPEGGTYSDYDPASELGVHSKGGVQSDYGPSSDVAVSSDFDRNLPVNSQVTASSTKSPRAFDSGTERFEEKKDDDSPSSEQKVGSLKNKWRQWEAKSTANSTPSATVQSKPKEMTQVTNNNISNLGSSLGVEMLTTDIVEVRRQEQKRSRAEQLRQTSQETPLSPDMLKRTSSERKVPASQERASECGDQRTSFASLRERLKPANGHDVKAKSDVGTSFRSSIAADVVDRLRRESPRNGAAVEMQSDGGSTPSFLANVKLRKTNSAKKLIDRADTDGDDEDKGARETGDRPMSYRERRAQEQGSEETELTPEKQVERKLTYRERRELELKREQEEKAKLESKTEKNPPQKDVASLIRKRIASNKQKCSTDTKAEKTVTQFCDNLKVSVPSPIQTESLLSLQQVGSTEHTPRSRRQSPTQSSPRWSDQQARQPSPGQKQPSPRFHGDRAPDPMSSNGYNKEPVDSALLDFLSPSSAGTEMEYSTATDHSSPRHRVPVQTKIPEPQNANSRLRPFVHQNQYSGSASSDPEGVSSLKGVHEPKSSHMTTNVKKLPEFDFGEEDQKSDVKSMLSNFLGARNNPLASIPPPVKTDDAEALKRSKKYMEESEGNPSSPRNDESEPPPPPPQPSSAGNRLALKDDPNYDRYFRMLKVGMPMDVVKHAMERDGKDPSVMDGDHNKPVGLPLKDDPKYTKYFKMLKMGISMNQVKHSMENDGMMPEVMDQDHNLPAVACEKRSREEPKTKDTHRRARLHWKTLRKVSRNSLWGSLEKETTMDEISFDEEEFKELFQADLTPSLNSPKGLGASRKKGAAVRVIDAKRANNGGIILARVKMTHDEMADSVDRMDADLLSAEQIENIIEYLPTKEERTQLEKYMLEGGQDAADKFDGLCECEKFMVSMMTVKHAKRKVRALLFKLQFMNCIQSIADDTRMIDFACDELKHSTRLRQLLGIVLQFGNRLNTAGANSKRKAGAFTLDSLLKLNEAKAFDKKTTFLNYVVLIVQRNNELLLNFVDDIPTVFKADKVYWDQVLSDLEEVENQLENVRMISLHEARTKRQSRLQKTKETDEDDSLGDIELTLEEEVEALRATSAGLFTLTAIKQVSALRDKVESTRGKFETVLEYFGEDAKSMPPHALFGIFCKFGRAFNKAKEETFANMKKKIREERKKIRNQTPNSKNGKPPSGPERKPLRLSSHQPNMSKVIRDFQTSQPDERLQNISGNGMVSPKQAPVSNQSQMQGKPGPMQVNSAPPSNSPYPRSSAPTPQKLVQARREKSEESAPKGRSMQINSAPPSNSPYSRRSAPASQNLLHSRPDMPEETVPKGRSMQVNSATQSNSPYSRSSAPTPQKRAQTRPEIPEEPVPRGMQEAGHFQESSAPSSFGTPAAPSSVPNARDSAKAALREKARNRRQRQMQVVSGRTTPVVSNTSLTRQPVESRGPDSDSSPSPPMGQNTFAGNASSLGAPPRSSAPQISSRHAMRHRRRLEAMKRSPPTSNVQSPSRTAADYVQ